MAIEKISTDRAPAAIGPYSQGVRAGGFIFFSGQIPLDPRTGNLVDGGIREQAERVMCTMKDLLNAAGLDFEHVVKTTIYLTDLSQFQSVNEIYGRFWGEVAPARATVEVAALPKGAEIEIDWVAFVG